VRQALSLAIDRTAIQRSTMRGLSVPAALMVAPGVNGHSTEIDTPAPANADAARKGKARRVACELGELEDDVQVAAGVGDELDEHEAVVE
jgi:ABC-type oligopeptide transport system substrate-binding subunit